MPALKTHKDKQLAYILLLGASTSFLGATLTGAAAGFAGGFVAGTGIALSHGANIINALGAGFTSGAFGALGGAVAGAAGYGFNALFGASGSSGSSSIFSFKDAARGAFTGFSRNTITSLARGKSFGSSLLSWFEVCRNWSGYLCRQPSL